MTAHYSQQDSEQCVVHEGKIDQCLTMLRTLLVKLFGDIDGEHPTGRLPIVEAKIKDHERRIKRLEDWKLKWVTVIAVLQAAAVLFLAYKRH